MGYEVERFVNRVDEEYICSICLGVFESPVHGPCGHTFCMRCIENWIPVNVNSCPLDKKPLFKKDLVAVSIPFRNLLNKLDIKCDFEPAGCTHICLMSVLPSHVKVCPFNPDGEMICEQGCDLTFLRRDRDSHKCIAALKEVVAKQRCEIADLKRLNAKRTHDAAFYRFPSDRSTLSEFMSVHEDRQMELINRHRHLYARSARRNYADQSASTRARTPPPPNISISSRMHQAGAAGSAAAQLTRSRLSVPMELAEVQVQVQRLTDEDLDLYGVTRPLSQSSILSSQLSMQPQMSSQTDRSSVTDLSSASQQSLQMPSSSTSSYGSSSSSSSSASSSQEVEMPVSSNRFNLLTRMLTNSPGCSSTRND